MTFWAQGQWYGFKARSDGTGTGNDTAQVDVEDLCENICKLVCASFEHNSGNVVLASSLMRVDSAQSFSPQPWSDVALVQREGACSSSPPLRFPLQIGCRTGSAHRAGRYPCRRVVLSYSW